MIQAITIGREGSEGYPGKNVASILGRPTCWYPMKALQESELVDDTFVSTDFDAIADIAREMDVTVFDRDPDLATSDASSKDAFKDGYEQVLDAVTEDIEMVVLAFCNSPTMMPGTIDEGIRTLRENEDLDSAVPVSRYNMRSPVRAYRIEDERLEHFVDPETIEGASTDRDTQPDAYFADCSFFVVRPRCFDFNRGKPPFPWIGDEIYPIESWGGLDIDYEWQVPQVEYWLREHGFSEDTTPYDDE